MGGRVRDQVKFCPSFKKEIGRGPKVGDLGGALWWDHLPLQATLGRGGRKFCSGQGCK